MRLVAVLIIYFAVGCLSLQSSDCFSLSCDTTTTTDNCISVDASSVTFTPCSTGYTCDSDFTVLQQLEDFTNSSCEVTPVVNQTDESCPSPEGASDIPTGFYCCVDADCYSGSCSSNKCEGVTKGNECNNTDEYCWPDLYCLYDTTGSSNSTCQEQVSDGDECDRDSMCYNGYRCNILADGEKGTCKQLYSLDLGESSRNPILCISGYLTDDNLKCDALTVYIGENEISHPYKCNINDTCIYKSYETGQVISNHSTCYCDGTSTTTGYCGDDIEYVKGVLDTMHKKIRYSGSICSGKYSHSDDMATLLECESISNELYTYYSYSLQQAQYWPIYQSGAIDGCLLGLDLFDPSYDEDSYSVASVLIVTMAYLIVV